MSQEPTDLNANPRPSNDKREAVEKQQNKNDFPDDLFASDPTIPPPSLPASFAQKRPLQILITDDNLINRNVIRTIVERLGYTPIEASGGEEALSLLQEVPFDLLFTDIDMPGMNGIELAQAVRAHESKNSAATDKTEIIAVTANTSPETRKRCKQGRMNGFLEKPVDPETIKKQILKSWRRIKTRPSRI